MFNKPKTPLDRSSLKVVFSCKNNQLRQPSAFRIAVIGTGHVAYHLATAWHNAGQHIVAVCGRNRPKAEQLAKLTEAAVCTDFTRIGAIEADVYLIAVADDAITEVVEQLPVLQGIVAHTSAFAEMKVLQKFGQTGVIYPLQTFSVSRQLDYRRIPFFIEGSSEAQREVLAMLASCLSDVVIPADGDMRRKYHLAAVFACNFSNHMYSIAAELLSNAGLLFELLKPLILETAAKATDMEPREAQTGPAKRNDKQTMNAHLDMLNLNPAYQDLYQQLSQLIHQFHAKKNHE